MHALRTTFSCPCPPQFEGVSKSIPSCLFLILSGHCCGSKCTGSMRQGPVSLCCILQGNCHPSSYQNVVGSGHCSLCHWGDVVWGGRQENPMSHVKGLETLEVLSLSATCSYKDYCAFPCYRSTVLCHCMPTGISCAHTQLWSPPWHGSQGWVD